MKISKCDTKQDRSMAHLAELAELLKEKADLVQHGKCNTKQDWCRTKLAELLKESSDMVQHSKCNTKQDWCRANLAELLKENSDLVQQQALQKRAPRSIPSSPTMQHRSLKP